MLYRPKCGDTCPLAPRGCFMRDANRLFYTLDFGYNDGSVCLKKNYFLECSLMPEPIPVDPKDIPEEILRDVRVRTPDEDDD